MSTQVIYNIEFSDRSNRECKVKIQYFSNTGGAVLVLENDLVPAASPFITRESSEEPLEPIRGSEASITFLSSEPFLIDLRNSHQWTVVLTVDNVVMWRGFLKADVLSQPYDDRYEEITLTAIDVLTALKSWDMDLTGEMGQTALKDIMAEGFAHIQDFSEVATTNIYYPAEYQVEQGDPYISPLLMTISRYNFFEEEDDEEAESPLKARTCYEALEAICKALGWSARMVGPDIWLESIGATSYCVLSYAAFTGTITASSFTDTAVSVPALDSSFINWYGTGHTYDVYQGYNQVSVTCGINYDDGFISNPETDDLSLQFAKITAGVDYTDDGTVKSSTVLQVYDARDNDVVYTFKKYQYSYGYGVDTPSITEVDEWTRDNFVTTCGSFFASFAYTNEVQYETEKNLSWVDALVLKCYTFRSSTLTTQSIYHCVEDFLGGRAIDYPLFICNSLRPAKWSEGALELTASVGYTNSSFVSDIISSQTISYPMRWVLRIGDLYYNGDSWQSNEAFFTVPYKDNGGSDVQWHELQSNKDMLLDLFDATGYIIRIDEELEGDVELRVLYPDSAELCQYPIFIKDFALRYHTNDYENTGETIDKKENIIFSASAGSGYTEKMDGYDIELHSYTNYGEAFGLLHYGTGIINTIYSAMTNRTLKPEKHLLAKLVDLYNRARRVLTLIVRNNLTASPCALVSAFSSLWQQTARKIDWKEDELELRLTDVIQAEPAEDDTTTTSSGGESEAIITPISSIDYTTITVDYDFMFLMVGTTLSGQLEVTFSSACSTDVVINASLSNGTDTITQSWTAGAGSTTFIFTIDDPAYSTVESVSVENYNYAYRFVVNTPE